MDDTDEGVIECSRTIRTRTKIKTLYHEFTHFILELFAVPLGSDKRKVVEKSKRPILSEEKICYEIENAVIKILDKYLE